MPGLDHALKVTGVTPLSKTLGEEVVADADHFTEKAPRIGMRDQFFDFDASDVAGDVICIRHRNN